MRCRPGGAGKSLVSLLSAEKNQVTVVMITAEAMHPARPAEGGLGAIKSLDARLGGQVDRRSFDSDVIGGFGEAVQTTLRSNPKIKKPGAVSRPGTFLQFQFHE
jgi:hypothetical protein